MTETSNINFLGVDGLNDIEPNYFYPDKENFTIPNKSSVVLATSGRLGNQFFQYAAAYSLAKETNSTLYVFEQSCASCHLKSDPAQDIEYHLAKFNLSEETILIPPTAENINLQKQFYPLLDINKVFKLGYTPDNVKALNGIYISSMKDFFEVIKNKPEKILIIASDSENPSFFDKYYKEILEKFVIPGFDTSNITDILTEVQKENAVCINVRGKEYLTSGFSIPISFQQEAIKFIEENKLIENPNYYVITDDVPYAKDGLKEFSNINYIAEGKGTLEHLYILRHCSNNIMAKSSFSWWGSFLNQRSKFTIVPCSYYDLYKPNHLTYKIQFPVNGTNKCKRYKNYDYVLQYKDENGNNIIEKRLGSKKRKEDL